MVLVTMIITIRVNVIVVSHIIITTATITVIAVISDPFRSYIGPRPTV
jgi:hypothetical protein